MAEGRARRDRCGSRCSDGQNRFHPGTRPWLRTSTIAVDRRRDRRPHGRASSARMLGIPGRQAEYLVVGFGVEASLPWLLDLYQASRSSSRDRLQQGGMVGGHVRSDCRDDGLVAVAPGRVTAFAPDDPGHLVLLERSTRAPLPECWHDAGVGAARLRIQLCGATTLSSATGNGSNRSFPARQGRAAVRLPGHQSRSRHRPRSARRRAWPEPVPASAAAQGSNPLLSKLRRILGADAVEGRPSVRLRLPTDSSVDVEKAAETVHRGRVEGRSR